MAVCFEQARSILQSLQQAMVVHDVWSSEDVSAAALLGQQPFCADTMNFSQWLQFVLIPRMSILIETQQALPQLIKGQGIEPMATEYYKDISDKHSLLMLIRQFDELLQIEEG